MPDTQPIDHSDLPDVPEASGGVGTSTVSVDDVSATTVTRCDARPRAIEWGRPALSAATRFAFSGLCLCFATGLAGFACERPRALSDRIV